MLQRHVKANREYGLRLRQSRFIECSYFEATLICTMQQKSAAKGCSKCQVRNAIYETILHADSVSLLYRHRHNAAKKRCGQRMQFSTWGKVDTDI